MKTKVITSSRIKTKQIEKIILTEMEQASVRTQRNGLAEFEKTIIKNNEKEIIT